MAICQRTLIVTLVLTVVGMMSSACFGQVNASCVVSILNRNVQVNANGTWVIPNIPANFGPVRARTTCVENGVTRSGQSDFFTIPTNGSVDIPRIVLGSATPIPNQVTVNATTSNLTKAGQTAQLNVVGKYADGGSKNLTSASTGTQYLVSNPALGTITTDGLVTATQSGTLLIQAINEGTQGLLQINIALSGDTDGDGIPDDVELRLGMNPNNPADAQEDPDHDGLTNLQEYRLGTDMRDPDSDGDGLSDGQEVKFGTNPLLSDTDGDGVPDGIEVATGSNPRDPNSTNLPKALKKITVSPNAFTINIDSTTGTGSQQLSVTGEFNAGGTIDLTPRTRGTNYSSSNLSVCNFGAESGKVFGAADGTCTITVSNSGFTATVAGTVRNFTPTALSFIDIPGFANNVDVNGNFAYVAAGSAGLQVVNVTDRAKPQIVASRKTPGNANDVVVAGNFAYVADGSSGLQIINIANPVAPVIVGSVATAGDASDVVVYDNLAFVANGAGGLVIIDVSSRTAPKIVGSLALPGPAKGVDAEVGRGIAVVAAGVFGLYVIDISNRTAPKLISSLAGGDVRDVAIRGNFAYLAEISRGFTSVDLSNLFAPFITASTPPNTGGRLMDVVLAGQFALGADVNFVNGVPVISLANPAAPSPRAIIDFRSFRDDNGTGIAADGNYVYMTAEQGSFGTDNGVNGTTRLYIGQYSSREDKAGILPRITLTAPQNNVSVIRGTNVNIRANATDDIGVESVIFSANGVDVGSDSSEPYETLYLVPVNATVLSIRARAVDFGGNVAQSGTVTVTTIADPLTIARGRAVDVNNVAVSGAQVTCQGKTAITDAAGGFQITGLSTIAGDIFCSATASVSGVRFFGASQGFVPAVAGVTNIGSFTLRGPGKTKIVGGSEHTCGLNAQGGGEMLGKQSIWTIR